jgi:hypothetical protein
LSQRRSVWWRSVSFDFPFATFRFFNECIRVKLPRKIFDRGDDARGRTIHGIADDCVAAIVDGV